jgi:hypothetical protein
MRDAGRRGTAAVLPRCWPHDRAHKFFSRARWNADDLGLAAAKLVVALLAPAGQPVTVAIGNTLFRRRAIEDARQVFGAGQGPAASPAPSSGPSRSSSPARPSPPAGTPPPGTTSPTPKIPAR